MTTATHRGDWLSEALSYEKDNEISRLLSERQELIAAAKLLMSQYDAEVDFRMGGQLTNEPFLMFRALLSRLK